MSTRSGVDRFRRFGFVLALAALVANLTGCVQRRMTVRSNPPGALVYIDDYEIGTTPVSTDYIYYGTRKIRLVKEGYETLTVYQPMPAPCYEWPGVDFFSENVWPGKIRDERAYDFQMQPLVQVPAEQVLGRAEQLRAASRVIPAAAADRSAADCCPGAGNDRAAARRVRAAAGWSAPQFLQRAQRPGADLRPARRSTSAGNGAVYATARANLHSQFEPSANWRRAELRSARRVRAEQYNTVVSWSAADDQSATSPARLATALWAVADSKFIAALSVIRCRM